MTEPCMCNDRGHYQGSYSERKECGVIGAYSFLAPISDDEPCGSYLKLDRSAYRGIRNAYNAAQSSFRQLVETPDASHDQTLLENNSESWGQLREITEDALLNKTKDLEILGWFITSQLFSGSPFENLAQSTSLISGLVSSYWKDMNPKPPEEKLKATDETGRNKEWAEFRTKPLLQLVGESNESTSIYVPLQMLAVIGDVTYGDYLRAEKNGTLGSLKEQALSSYSNECKQTLLNLSEAYVNLQESEKAISEKSIEDGATAISFRFIKSNIEDLIKAIQFLVGDKIRPWPLDANYHVASEKPAPEPSDANLSIDTPEDSSNTETVSDQQTITVKAIAAGEIVNRDHAFKELRKIADYFRDTEPHSPISFLLERAIRWGYLSLPELFDEIIGDNSSTLGQVNQLTGMDNLDIVDLANISILDRPMRQRNSMAGSSSSIEGESGGSSTSSAQASTSEEPSTSSGSSSDFEW